MASLSVYMTTYDFEAIPRSSDMYTSREQQDSGYDRGKRKMHLGKGACWVEFESFRCRYGQEGLLLSWSVSCRLEIVETVILQIMREEGVTEKMRHSTSNEVKLSSGLFRADGSRPADSVWFLKEPLICETLTLANKHRLPQKSFRTLRLEVECP